MKRITLSILALLTLTGCNGMGGRSDVITAPPSNWQKFEGTTVTLEGSAGNSPSGPILRFNDGSWIGLQGFRLWAFDVITRPVGITGTVARGTGARDGEYVIDVKEWYLQTVSQVPTQVPK
jgi:hypothetical protein